MLYTPCDKKNYHKNVDANVARLRVVVICPAGSHTLLKILMNTFRGWGPASIYNTQQSIDLLPDK